MTRPVLLDLYSGAGIGARGYMRAGFDVVGVDVAPQPRYPGRFIRADVLTLDLPSLIADLGVVALHASPPCLGNTRLRAFHPEAVHPDLIPATRDRLVATGLPYIIENVPGASTLQPLIMLCGTMFGLRVIRHRYFESNVLIWSLPHQCAPPNATGAPARDGEPRRTNDRRSSGAAYVTVAGHMYNLEVGRRAMGVDDWVTREELSLSIPPAYTAYLGGVLLQYVSAPV